MRKIYTLAIVAGLALGSQAQSLPATPMPQSRITRRDLALVGAGFASAAFDAYTTQRDVAHGCTEVNPLVGTRPSVARIWTFEMGLTGAQVLMAYGFKRLGHPKIAGIVAGQIVVEHAVAGVLNARQSCF